MLPIAPHSKRVERNRRFSGRRLRLEALEDRQLLSIQSPLAGLLGALPSYSGANQQIVVAPLIDPNASPTVTTAASATPSTVTGTTTVLSVLGADDGGEANLTYTWAATVPSGAKAGDLQRQWHQHRQERDRHVQSGGPIYLHGDDHGRWRPDGHE